MSFEQASDEELWKELDQTPQPCCKCGGYGDDVELVADPMLSEVHGEISLIWCCDPCYLDLLNEA